MKDVHDLEIYAPIKGYTDYLVTSHGRILSLKGNKIKEIKKQLTTKGYETIRLSENGIVKNCSVHRLVATAFISNPYNKSDVNHKDENPLNNNISNLEWMTHKENLNYGKRKEKFIKSVSKKVIGYSLTEIKVIVLKSTNSGNKFGFNDGHISSCCRKRKSFNSHKGYTWKYIDNKNED